MMSIQQTQVVLPECAAFNDGFGYWLAGFIDGEGSFGIAKIAKDRGYFCRLVIQVRDDDRPILEEIKDRTGLGTIYAKKARGTARAGAVWNVSNKTHCLGLVSVLDRYPLRAKKVNDYRVWREAVLAWQEVHSGQVGFDWSTMAQLKLVLQSGKLYPDGARSDQPLTACTYQEAVGQTGVTFDELSANASCASGVCGV